MPNRSKARTAKVVQQSKVNLEGFSALIGQVDRLRRAALHEEMPDDQQVALAANFTAAMEHLLLANLQYATWSIREVRDSIDVVAVGPNQRIELGTCFTDANSPCRTISLTAEMARRRKPH